MFLGLLFGEVVDVSVVPRRILKWCSGTARFTLW